MRLPLIDPPVGDETRHAYGCRVLAFVLHTGCTATLTDDDLALADHVYPIAVGHREILPCAVDTLSAVRHLILQALANRRHLTEQRTDGPVVKLTPPAPDQGQRARLQLRPFRRPPAGVAVDVGF